MKAKQKPGALRRASSYPPHHTGGPPSSSSGFTILSCHGSRGAEASGFEGFHELLLPLLDRIDALPPRQRMTLKVAFGAEGEPADRFITGLASFELLEEAAARGSVVLLVEDLNWLDQSTADIVSFLAALSERAADTWWARRAPPSRLAAHSPVGRRRVRSPG
ncbi:hypothetical protein ACFYZE_28530 [Streptomyces sp. NPDC001796]|uniref:hypothetical protein n=1 Tax=Streptomyces sp. NPDC001796 TaxID=3364609 RepID=UPI0036861B58